MARQIDGIGLLASCFLIVSILVGCSGDDGEDGEPGGITGVLSASTVESIQVEIDEVSIESPPVVSFTATDDNGVPVTGLQVGRGGNLRFTMVTLLPGTGGDPSAWKNYIVSSNGQATYERDGVLEDLGNGQYRYNFETDITTSPDYDASRRHRVAMQIDGFPATNPSLDFRPDGGSLASTIGRDIVETETCNTCHNKLAIHGGGRVEVKYCVTCHTPDTIDPDSGNTVDFKVMTHKIHMGEHLPSVAFGPDLIDDGGGNDDGTGVYQIVGYGGSVHDYSTVVFPQDIRNCTTCHDGAAPQGDNWQSAISIEACGSCHDNIDFSKDGSAAGANDPLGHSGGIVSDNSECVTCHASGRIAGSVAERHALPINAAVGKFEFRIHKICSTSVPDEPGDPEPNCSGAPNVRFSVRDPSGGAHGYGDRYDIVNDPEFGAGASLNILTGWDSFEYDNDGGDGSRPSRANSMDLATLKTNATDKGNGTFTVTLDPLPAGVTDGSGVVAIEGHPRAESVVGSGNFDTSVPVRGVTAHFGINGDPMVERRVAVDITEKCDNCHKLLSLHGNNRADNAQLCVICHNPRGTDIGRRDIDADGIPDVSPLDGKREETIDFKVLIHAIHAGEQDDPDTGDVEGHGVREQGIVVYGYGNNSHDYSHVRFPGILNDCTSCHNDGTYELEGKWEAPMQNGILATTVQSAPTAVNAGDYTAERADQSDDLFTTPTGAVCSACHDGATARAHMEQMGGAMFAVDLATVNSSYETCSVCHGPGKIADLNTVHGIE